MKARANALASQLIDITGRAYRRGVLDLTAARGAVLFFGFLQNVVLARMLQPQGLGHISVITATMSFGAIASTAGLTTAILRYGAVQSREEDSWAVYRVCARLCTRVSFLVTLVVAALAWSPLWVFDPVAGAWMPLVALMLPVTSLGTCGLYYLHARSFMREKAILESAGRLLLLFTVVGGALADGFRGAVIGLVVGSLLGALLSLWRVRAIRPDVVVDSPVPQRELLRFSTWSLFGQVLSTVLVTASVFCISAVTDDASAVGHYSLAALLQQIANAPMLAYLDATFPNMAREAADPALLRSSRRRMRRHLFALTAVTGGGLALVAPFAIPMVFGEAFRESVMPLAILLIGQVFWSLGAPAGRAMLAAGWVEGNFWTSAVAGVLNIGACLLLIPPFGIVGAALATAGANAAWAVIVTLMARRLERRLAAENAAGSAPPV